MNVQIELNVKHGRNGRKEMEPRNLLKLSAKMKAQGINDFALLVSPTELIDLIRDPAFIDASSYGSNKSIKEGEIGSIFGIRIFSNTKVTGNRIIVISRDLQIDSEEKEFNPSRRYNSFVY